MATSKPIARTYGCANDQDLCTHDCIPATLVESGYPVGIGACLERKPEPQVQLIYQCVDVKNAQDDFGRVRYPSNSSMNAPAGVSRDETFTASCGGRFTRWIYTNICRAIILMVLCASALAQDTGRGAGYVANGPVFDLPAGISVERQEVYVSLHSVRLIYLFKSLTQKIVNFSFVMSDMPVDASPDAVGLSGGAEAAGLSADRQPPNYLNLSVRVNGTLLALVGRGQALFNGSDVTRQLLDARVPLIYDVDGEAPWRRLPSETQAMLQASGLLDIDAAQWTFRATFEWNQTFGPGDTRIEVSYTPVADYWSDITLDHLPEIESGGSATQAYCIDDALRRAFFRKPTYELYTVTHGMTSSGGWRGPIGNYRLVVDKDAATDMVAFCPLAAKKTTPTTFEWNATDFTPGSEVGVLFFVDPAVPSSSK